jgi:hypothetical protein
MEVVPYISIGNLSFGDLRDEARSRIASRVEPFSKVPGKPEVDAYDDLGMHLYYDEEDRLEFVEAFEPANVTFRGVSFLGRWVTDIKSDMKSLGFSYRNTDVGLIFDAAGISITAEEGIAEGVGAFKNGYYETASSQHVTEQNDVLCDFNSPCGQYRLTFDDDGKVAYAYLRRGSAIVGDVWVYNRCPTPEEPEWKDRRNLPFANCKPYTSDEGTYLHTIAASDISVNWMYRNDEPTAFVYLAGKLVASVGVGQKPGSSRFASMDGPLAKKLLVDSQR